MGDKLSQSESEFFRVRLEKVKKLRDMGIDPYPARFDRTHTSAEAISEFEKVKFEKVIGNKSKAEAKIAGITPAVFIFSGRWEDSPP